MPEKEAVGGFDYSWEEPDGVDVVDEESASASEGHFDYLLDEDQSRQQDRFDAFDETTWDGEVLTPASAAPWYRSPQARTLLIATATAVSAIVISVVLLVFRDSWPGGRPVPASITTVVTTPVATATSERPPTSQQQPPPAPPPPPPAAPAPPPAPAPPTVNQAPPVVAPIPRPAPTKEPQLNVTRPPISVAPQPHRPR